MQKSVKVLAKQKTMTQQANVKTQANLSLDAIKEAHELSENPDKLREYYDKWANAYDTDVTNEKYSGPEYIAHYLMSLHQKQQQKELKEDDKKIEILDAGCGTGLVGEVLKQLGYPHVDGFDISNQMVERADKTGAYRALKGEIDMSKKIDAYKDNQYDATVCCGVFTHGHVPPAALSELFRITKPGGLVVVSTRKSYYENTDFKAVCDRVQQEGEAKLVHSVMEGPYIAEEGAHYWAFEVC
ncbi:class I SAM-dependent DNA methyltransferase [Phormidium sp. CCY1219]|uniref:class I SAM-dependent DNA methyltransferase n=1 Tax=Phormidium sp. CCY1219 TaxID=2886104 RepID=UPI002D1F0E5E|nr:class I SAM-dependent methyltransferase [Phormidium sp. CCY1219]MEB3829006.1 class I SAM-dependent methyltransferase [Phormidium sp. CCY1219]